MIQERECRVSGRGVSLEGRLSRPPAAAGGFVLCHPHPLHGGDMHNPVIERAAQVCAEAGLATLRFNFRGVGGSTGSYADGVGEQEDVGSALDALAAATGPRPLGVIGYSFGALVGARVAVRDARVTALAAVAPALTLFDFGFLASPVDRGRLAVLLVGGTRDELCPVDALEALGRSLPGSQTQLIEGADHFFFGKLYPLGAVLGGFARKLAGQPSPGATGASPG
jgi:alpha/beta superfamily hydrolase